MNDRVALLIDGDNISSMAVIEQALLWVSKHYGGPHVRRVHCTPEWALSQREGLMRLSIRPLVNLSSGKNSTDIALAADAMELAITERPDVFVIVSSDSDFTALVARLREKGCKVVGIGQEGKTGRAAVPVYDDFEVLAVPKNAGPAPAPAKKAAAKKTAAKKAPAKKTVAAKKPGAPAPTATPAPESAPAPALATPAKDTAPDKALAVWRALPELARGEELDLRVAAERLRKLNLLSKSGSSTKLLGQFPGLFELTLSNGKPHRVKARSGAGA